MKTWIREETRRGLRDAEAWRRREVQLHFQVLAFARGSASARPSGTSRYEAP
jgi:hypothetical protein